MARPFAIAVHGGRVFVTDYGDVQSGLFWLPPAGGAPTRLCTAGANIYALVTNGLDLYWPHAAGVSRVAIQGGSPVSIASTTEGKGVALSGGWIYWVRSSGTSGGVYRTALGGGPVQSLHTGTGFNNLVLVGSTVYAASYSGLVASVPASGGTLTTIATGQGGTWGIASNGSALVWANHTAGELVRYPLPAGPAKVIASGVGGAHQVAMVGEVVYATGDTSGRVVRIRPGHGVEDLATNVGRPKNLVVDGSFVYFTDDVGGRVLRVAR